MVKLFWLLPVLLAFLFNLNVLQNGLGWDDEKIIPNLSLPERSLSLFFPDPTTETSPKETSFYFRPLVSLSYHLDQALWGDNPFGFHLSVLLAHLLNTALVFFLARALMAAQMGPAQGPAPTFNSQLSTLNFFPLLASSLFAVHPIHAEAVAWIAGRNDVFCTVFLLLAMVLYIRFNRRGGGWVYGSSMFSFFLALLTKEIAVGLIVLFPLYDYLSGGGTVRRAELWRRIGLRGAVPLGIMGVYLWMRSAKITYPYSISESVLSPLNGFSGSTFSEAIGALGLYLKLLLFPYPHNPFIATVPASPLVLILSGLVGCGLLAGLIFALIRRQVVLAMGLAWMIVTLLPAILVAVFRVPSAVAAERYLYAPSAGFLITASWLFLNTLGKLQVGPGRVPRRVRITAGLILTGIVSVGGMESWSRNAVWSSPVTFWEAAVAAAPYAGLPHRNLGVQYDRLGRYAEAEILYRRAIVLDGKVLGSEHPLVARDLYNLANHYRDHGKQAEAELLYQRAIAIWMRSLGPEHPDLAAGLNNLGVLYQAQGRYAEAEAVYRRSAAIREKVLGLDHPMVAKSLHNLALLYQMQGRYAEAEPLYRSSLEILERILGPAHPDVARGLENYAKLLRLMNRGEEAAGIETRIGNGRVQGAQ